MSEASPLGAEVIENPNLPACLGCSECDLPSRAAGVESKRRKKRREFSEENQQIDPCMRHSRGGEYGELPVQSVEFSLRNSSPAKEEVPLLMKGNERASDKKNDERTKDPGRRLVTTGRRNTQTFPGMPRRGGRGRLTRVRAGEAEKRKKTETHQEKDIRKGSTTRPCSRENGSELPLAQHEHQPVLTCEKHGERRLEACLLTPALTRQKRSPERTTG